MSRAARIAPAFLTLLAACGGDGTGPGPTPPPAKPAAQDTAIRFSGATGLTPGGAATLSGKNLDRVTDLQIEGQTVAFAHVSASEITFPVPASFGRACETDGRPLRITGTHGATLNAPLQLTDTVNLAVGEVRTLDAAALKGTCLAFAANDQEYVLSALNPAVVASEQLQTLLTFRTYTASDAAPAAAARGPSPQARFDRIDTPNTTPRTSTGSGTDPFSAHPIDQDHYATAQVGDTVHFLNNGIFDACITAKKNLSYFPTQVVAVAGNTVIVVDLRLPNAAEQIANAAAYQQAAAIADPLIEPTMRNVFGPHYRPILGGGGRAYHLITEIDNVGQAGITLDIPPQSECPNSPEMILTAFNAHTRVDNPSRIRTLAGGLIHEYAHNADYITARRAGYEFGSTGWMMEGWAENAQETAARLSTGQATNVNPAAVPTNAPLIPFWGMWGSLPGQSPWTGGGTYNQGAQLLLYAREALGSATIGSPANLYEQLLGKYNPKGDPAADFNTLAGVVGQQSADLLAASVLAWSTEGLIAPNAAQTAGLPWIQSWDYQGSVRTAPRSTYPGASTRHARSPPHPVTTARRTYWLITNRASPSRSPAAAEGWSDWYGSGKMKPMRLCYRIKQKEL